MKYNSIIEYIKETYPYIITSINEDNDFFIIKNMFIIGLFKNNKIYKIDIPFHIGIDNISKCSGFNDNDHDDLLKMVDNSDLITKEYNLQPLQYQIFYDKSSNIFIPIYNDYLYKIPKIINRYEMYLDKIKECQIKIIEDKENIIKDLHQYKNNIINYIIDNKLESQDINKIHKTIQDENAYYKDKLHSLYKCNANPEIDELQLKEFIYELHTELINLQNDLNKSQLKTALLERYKNESRNIILSEKENIIKSIKKYHYNWLEWLDSIDFSDTNDIDHYKYILLKQLKLVENKFKDLLKSHSLEEIDINSSLSREDFKKLKQNITDLQSEITNVIQDELIQLSIKDSNYNYNKELSNDFLIHTNDNNDRWPDDFYYIKDDLNEINSLLLQNKNTKIEMLKQFTNISDCYLIIQNFLTLNNIFYRTQTIVKKLENIIYNNLPPFRYLSEDIQKKLLVDFDLLKLEINNNIDFLNLNSYINDVNLKRFKTKSGIENYYKNRSKDENDFCIHLFNIIKFWNINKKYYTNINTRLTNIYEDISGHIQIYIRIKPYIQHNIQIEQCDNNPHINNLINTNIYINKKQFCISISSEKEKHIFNDFYGIFDESHTNFNLFTGNKKENEIIKELNQEVDTDELNNIANDEDYDKLEEINYGLYKTFRNLENGYSSVLISYGSSCSGKTFSLFGDQNTNGVLYYGLKNLKNVSNISLEYLFEQYYNNNNLTNNKISGNIHNLINNINLQNLEISNTNIYIDETNEFYKRLPSYIDINDINIDNIDSLFNIIDNYRKSKGRICKTPNNVNSNRSHLYMIFKITFNENQEKYLTIIDTASKESPYDLFNYFMDNNQTKLQLIMAPEPIGGIQKIKRIINPSIIDNYSPSDILKILNESFYINETINHLTYFLNKSKRLTDDDHQTGIDKYNISKFFVSPVNEMYAINDSNCLTIPILNFINNLQATTKYTILCCINQEKQYYNQTISTLEFADKIKKI